MKAAVVLLFSSLLCAQNAHIPILEKALNENILNFWYPSTLDTKHGGYEIRRGPTGEPKGEGPKGIVTQARQVWLFSRVARAGYGAKTGYLDKAKLLAAADHGYKFLRDKMWDAKNGGFYWETDASGNAKSKPKKHLYGNSFGLYAVSEFALSSGRKDVRDFAVKIFETIDRRAHDAQFGGYREFFAEDWSELPASEASYMAGGSAVKLMNTHLHLMEAMTTYYRLVGTPVARERLWELFQIQSNSVVRKDLGACTDQYERDWTPRLGPQLARVSYGHDIENIWLLADTLDALGMPAAPYLDLFKTLFAYSMKYGWDDKNGGFYYIGNFREPADDKRKSWWVQAEALVSALTMFQLTKDPQYYAVFEKTWDFVNRYQIDWKNGEWHDTVMPDLTARGDKAQIWKAGYHNGRAMIESIARLKAPR